MENCLPCPDGLKAETDWSTAFHPLSTDLWDCMHAGTVLDLCREHGPQVLPMLVEGRQSAAALEAVWRAVCILAQDSTESALDAWLSFVQACR